MLNLGYVSNNLGFGGGKKLGTNPPWLYLPLLEVNKLWGGDIDWNPELAKNDGI